MIAPEEMRATPVACPSALHSICPSPASRLCTTRWAVGHDGALLGCVQALKELDREVAQASGGDDGGTRDFLVEALLRRLADDDAQVAAVALSV